MSNSGDCIVFWVSEKDVDGIGFLLKMEPLELAISSGSNGFSAGFISEKDVVGIGFSLELVLACGSKDSFRGWLSF